MFTNSSWSVRKRRTSAARRPIWVADERSASSTPPWRKRWSASASSASGVSMRSSAFLRNVDLSSLIQLWMQLRISSSRRCSPAMRKAASVVSGSAARAVRGCGRLSSTPSSPPGARAGTVERRRRSASSTPFQHRWLIILRPRRAEQRPVGLPQEVEHHPPLRGGRARPAVDRQHALQAAARDEVAEPLGDRVEELPLLGEEGPLVRAGHGLRVVDLDLPGDLALRLEQRRQLERRGREARPARTPGCRGRSARRTRPGTASPREWCGSPRRGRRRGSPPRGREARRRGRGS